MSDLTDNVMPTQADREALEALDDELGFLTEKERPIVLHAFARHRQAAYEKGLKDGVTK